MRIQLPDYQGQVDRVLEGFDSLVNVYREKQARDARSREYARKQLLQKNRQNFQVGQAKKRWDHQLKLTKRNETFRKEIMAEDHQLKVDDASAEFKRSEQVRKAQNEFKAGLQQAGFTHDEQMQNAELGAEAQQAQASQQVKYSKILQDRTENVRKELDGKYQKAMLAGNIKFTGLGTTKAGQVVLKNVSGSVFNGEDVTFDQFRNRMQDNMRTYAKIKDAEDKAGKGYYRRLSDTNTPSQTTVPTDEGKKTLFTYESYIGKLNNDLMTGGGKDGEYGFTNKVYANEYLPDTRSDVPGSAIKGKDLYEEFKSKPVTTFKIDGKNYTFNFLGDTKNQLLNKQEEIQNLVSNQTTNGNYASEVAGVPKALKIVDKRIKQFNDLQNYIREVDGRNYDPNNPNKFKLQNGNAENVNDWYGYSYTGGEVTKGNQRYQRESNPWEDPYFKSDGENNTQTAPQDARTNFSNQMIPQIK